MDNLSEIEIQILDTLYDIKYANKIYFKLESNIFNLENNIESIKEISYYLEKLKENNYISYGKLPLIKRSISNKEFTDIDWYKIFLQHKGCKFIEDYTNEQDKKEEAEIANLIYHTKKQKFEDAIKVISINDTYYEISIKIDNKVVDGIKIDKHLLYKIKEYSWFVNNCGNIVTLSDIIACDMGYRGTKRNKAIYQILFEEEIDKINKETGYSNIAYFKNGDKLDNRRENIIFIPRNKQVLYKNLNKVTGIYLSSSNAEDHNSYEVKIKKNNEQIYLTKTTNYEEALKGAFLLRLVFYGKNFTNAFVEKLDIDQNALDNLDETIKNYIATNNTVKFKNALIDFNIEDELVDKLMKVIKKKSI